MSQQQFVTGQRWVSDTEAELGLGIVLEVDERQLTLGFPAAGQRRTYALRSAPVSRVRYQVDEAVQHQDGTSITIREVLEQGLLLAYRGVTEEGEEQLIPEFELDSFVQFSTPRERLFSGQIDKYRHFSLRYQTLETMHQHRASPAYGLSGPRVQPLPHQLYIASEVARRPAPRVLLADEVGLGKTIEAGLILHQQLMTGRVRRALLVVPESLQHQWLVEMLRRFNLSFTLLDEERCQALMSLDDIDPSLLPEGEDIVIAEADDNPFESEQLILTSLEFLVGSPNRYQQAVDAGWDLLLVDEAHHLQWQGGEASPEYACIEGLSSVAAGLLLLTATPEQLGMESHFARLRLLDPERYHDLATFLSEQAGYAALNEQVQQLLAARDADTPHWPADLEAELSHWLSNDALQRLKREAEESPVAALDSAIHQLLDRHGTGRVLFRNTRASVSGFPQRCLHRHELDIDEQLLALSERPLREQLQPESFWQDETGEDWWLVDPRVAWLTEFLKSRRGHKVLVICANADSAQSLELYLRLRKGVASAVFHEGLSLLERDRSAAYFADGEMGAQVLICSEIGSEGRNFQFAQDLVLFDLPLNPDLLEQRIGRLDRIGQQGDVNIHVPFYPDTAQERLMMWYHEGLDAFERTCAIGRALYDAQESRLLAALVDSDSSAFEALLDDTRAKADALREQLQAGRDRLLELNSCQPDRVAPLVSALQEQDHDPTLADYLERVLNAFGVDQEEHSEKAWVIHPSEHMRVPHFPGLIEDGMTITFDRNLALSREDIHYLSWEHPLVHGAQEMIAHSEFGNTALATIKLPPLKPGTLLVEALFVLHCPAPTELQLDRYLPESVLRVLIDPKGKDLSQVLSVEKLDELLQKVPRPSAQDLVRHARPQLSAMMDQAEALVGPRQQALVDDALAAASRTLSAEKERLEALAEVNPNVRRHEIEALGEQRDQAESYLRRAQLRLDAVRVIMTV
ncbi:RNA polymerase-associated protein RapA [Marinimicrobium sp. ARAG 43.8]|uniref:RNA polymerase-associated protein RapA n=1 Tax=Marinimicrobium sp. ARAG 43.8 TaxID=3418719 RepID=UPI003CE96B4C